MHHRDSVDLLQDKNPLEPERVTRAKLSALTRFFLFSLSCLAIGGIFASVHIAKMNTAQAPDDNNISLFSSFRRLVANGDKALEGEADDRINILLLGVGGSGHEGPELTDTIMFGSFKPSTEEVGIISIPRDLTVNIDGYGWRKINHVNAYAEMEEPGSGPEAAKEKIGEILNQDISYTVKVDFKGFEEMIDAIGGITVYVERTFTDSTYPVDDGLGNVKTVTFEQGQQHMTGEQALIFARSRHGNNGENSDFARAERQQKILVAFKEKALSLETLLNPSKLNRVLGVITDNVETNLSLWEMMKLAKYVPSISMDDVIMHVLDNSSDSPLYETNINGAYVLLPKKDDWSDLQALADHIFETNALTVHTASTKTVQANITPGITIEVQNGTTVTGLAARTADLLQSSGFSVAAISNAPERNYAKTTIYDFTEGAKSAELAALQDYLDADVVMTPKGYLASSVTPTVIGNATIQPTEEVDFLIIIGENVTNVVMR